MTRMALTVTQLLLLPLKRQLAVLRPLHCIRGDGVDDEDYDRNVVNASDGTCTLPPPPSCHSVPVT